MIICLDVLYKKKVLTMDDHSTSVQSQGALRVTSLNGLMRINQIRVCMPYYY